MADVPAADASKYAKRVPLSCERSHPCDEDITLTSWQSQMRRLEPVRFYYKIRLYRVELMESFFFRKFIILHGSEIDALITLLKIRCHSECPCWTSKITKVPITKSVNWLCSLSPRNATITISRNGFARDVSCAWNWWWNGWRCVGAFQAISFELGSIGLVSFCLIGRLLC